MPHYNMIMVKPCFISKHMLGMNLKLNQYSILLSMFSLGMGLPSYNNDVGLCVFLFVKTKEYSHFVSYHFVIHITVKTYHYGTTG